MKKIWSSRMSIDLMRMRLGIPSGPGALCGFKVLTICLILSFVKNFMPGTWSGYWKSGYFCFQDQTAEETPELKEGILKQFIENLELENPNILRIVHMKSYSGIETLLFSSDHAAWRDTS